MGLLDPQSQGLLGLAAGLMSPTPGGSFGGAFASGLKGYQSARGGAQSLQNQMRKMQMFEQNFAQEMEGKKRERELRDMMGKVVLPNGSVDQAALRQVATSDPKGAEWARQIQQMMSPAPRKLMNVNGKIIDQADPANVLADYSTEDRTAFEKQLLAAGIEPSSDEGQKMMRAQIMKATTHAPAANVNVAPTINTNLPKQETEQSKAYGKSLGGMRANIMQAGLAAQGTISRYEQLGAALEGLEGGNLASAKTTIASALNSFGIKIDPRLGDKEFSESMAREVAASMRQTGTGPMTDKDFENFLKRVPDLSKSEAGRKQIIATAIAKAKRDQQVAQMAMEYADKNNGVIDDRFLVQVSQFVSSNPVIASVAAPEKVDFGDGWSMEPIK